MIIYEDILEQNPWWQGENQPEEASLPHRASAIAIRCLPI